ncbi:MAG: serine hydrolase [Verrucomicrobia bacterium]|nr:serine hydrolase [Verrucomicrobiota bacterium]
MKRLLILTSLLAFVLQSSALETISRPKPEIESAEINSIVRRHFPEDSKGGVAVLVLRDGKVLHSKGYGTQDEAPITPDTPMGLASVSKQLTAMCIAFLIEEGRLKLSDKVADHLPEVKMSVDGRELLVQDLLWHTGGLPNFMNRAEKESIAAYKKAHDVALWTNRAHTEWIATQALKRKPGTEFEYSNGGYALMARLVEVITKKPFHQFQQERLFDVLGMNQSSAVSLRFNGAGNVQASLNDYAKWDRALWDGSLVKPATWQMMTQSGTLDDGTPVGYGFGWHLKHENGELLEMTHTGGGSPPGNARNVVLRDLRHRLTVVFFSRENLQYTREIRHQIAAEIRDCALTLK